MAEDEEPGFRQDVTMIRIAVTAAAFEADSARLPRSSPRVTGTNRASLGELATSS
jgi:hypothetical protein